MIKVDLHIHVGSVYGNKITEDLLIDSSEVKKYLERNNIIHCCAVYTSLDDLQKLQALCSSIKFYPIQWVDKFTEIIHFEINKGIKLHSHRGRKDILGNRIVSEYDKSDSILEQLPDNYIVQYHTQTSTSLANKARGLTIARNAVKFPRLKHIPIHAGSFGLHSFYMNRQENSVIFSR